MIAPAVREGMLGPPEPQHPKPDSLYLRVLQFSVVMVLVLAVSLVAVSIMTVIVIAIDAMNLSADLACREGRRVDIYVCSIGGQRRDEPIEVACEYVLRGSPSRSTSAGWSVRSPSLLFPQAGHAGYGGRCGGEGSARHAEVHDDPAGHVFLAEVDVGLCDGGRICPRTGCCGRGKSIG